MGKADRLCPSHLAGHNPPVDTQICPSCGEANPARFRLCGFCGTLSPRLPRPSRFARSSRSIFVDLKGSTDLGERLDPEAMHEVKERYFTAMAAEIGGTAERSRNIIGDAIMAVFGLPRVHEDDALRAVRAAFGMQRRWSSSTPSCVRRMA